MTTKRERVDALLERVRAWPIAWPIPLAAIELIAMAEDCRLKAFRCPAGIWTIGWGTTAGVRAGMAWTQQQADETLRDELVARARYVQALLAEPAEPNELGAMASLAYNIGDPAFAKSTVLRCHNRSDRAGAARAFALWNKARVGGQLQELPGLTARRAAEAALYLQPGDDGPQPHMPQAVEPESNITTSPLVRNGASVAGAGILTGVASLSPADLAGQAGPIAATASHVAAELRSAADSIGVPPAALLAVVLVVAGGLVIRWRLRQRREGWA